MVSLSQHTSFSEKQHDSGSNFTRNANTSTHEVGTRCQGYCGMQWCDGYGFLLILTIIVYSGLLINEISKRKWCTSFSKQWTDATGKIQLQEYVIWTFVKNLKMFVSVLECLSFIYSHKKLIWIIAIIIAIVFLYIDTSDSRDRLRSLSGIVILYGLGYLFSKDMAKVSANRPHAVWL